MESSLDYARLSLYYRRKYQPNPSIWVYNLLGKIGSFYLECRQYDSAAKYFHKALTEAKGITIEYIWLPAALNNMGMLFEAEGQYDSADHYFQVAEQSLPLKIRSDSALLVSIVDNMAENEFYLGNYAVAEKIYQREAKLASLCHVTVMVLKSTLCLSQCNIAEHNNADALKRLKEAEFYYASNPKLNENKNKVRLYAARRRYDSATGNWKAMAEEDIRLQRISDSLYGNQRKYSEGLSRALTETQQLKANRDIQLYSIKLAQSKKESEHRRNLLIVVFSGLIALLFVLFLVIRERRRSEHLLLNILPAQTARELKVKGKAHASSYDMVTVMFTDVKDFTKLTERMTPQVLVEEIHYFYSEFDKIIHKYNVEKIKTIGDGYMAAGGLPEANTSNPVDTIKAALEIQAFMNREKEKRLKENKIYFELRVGIHSGPVVAGIVGIKKFAYDIRGDTVNTASRIETCGEVSKVTISGKTYELVKDHFNCTYQGKIEAKNKGMIDVYTVEGV